VNNTLDTFLYFYTENLCTLYRALDTTIFSPGDRGSQKVMEYYDKLDGEQIKGRNIGELFLLTECICSQEVK